MARKRGRGKKNIDVSGVLESVEGSAPVAKAAAGGSFLKRFAKGAGQAAIPAAVMALLGAGDDEEFESLVAQLQEGQDENAAGLAASRVGGLDRLMRVEREVAAQAPPGTPPATPIVDRLGVLMPELMDKLRQRVKGGLWADLAEGEVLIQGGPTSREMQDAENQQLELALKDELGFQGGPPLAMQALIG